MTLKMLSDNPSLDPEEAMDACVAAKNCTVNVYGYSPIQLAFVYAPTIPHFPAKGDAVTDEELSLVYKGYFKDRLQRMQDARVLAIGVMAKQRLRKALQHPIRANHDKMAVGDKVDWYNENSMKKGTGFWRGPGRLVILNPPMAVVQAGGRIVRRHVTHVRHTLQDTGLDVDGRDFVDQAFETDGELDDPVQQVVEGGEREHLATGEEHERAEVRDLAGRECIN